MTYVELIVAIAIFFTMSGIVLSNYRTFEDKVNIINLANDVGLKIVGAQKDASSGALPPSPKAPSVSWKPAYGVFFDLNDNTHFVYFTDLSNSGFCDSSCESANNISSTDYLDTINITGGNKISSLKVFYQNGISADFTNPLSLVFTRSNPGVIFETYDAGSNATPLSNVSYVLITLSSSSASTSEIEVYSSGRIQIN